jgi:hypothetical protein
MRGEQREHALGIARRQEYVDVDVGGASRLAPVDERNGAAESVGYAAVAQHLP